VNRLRIVFCGTPQFAVPSLNKLIAEPGFEILAIFTQPDRPRGRGQELSFSPVKAVAVESHIPVHQPEKIRAPEVEQQLRALAPDAIVIIAYGQIIPARLLPIPRLGWINLHASLLPKYRGAAPIHWAIANGETITGNTTMRIDAGMDTGQMLLQQQLPIAPDETSPELADRLSNAGAALLLDTLRGLQSGSVVPRRQDDSQATSAPTLKREDGLIDWARPAPEIYNRMRAFTPWPGAYTIFRGQTCHIWGRPWPWSAEQIPKELTDHAPGTILHHRGNWLILCGTATLLLLTHVKLEGRKQISAIEFANGARLQTGEQFKKQ
jgi:methionyl-tRNA formyltransferase